MSSAETVLERMPETEVPTPELVALGREAAQTLGYDRLERALGSDTELLRTFGELGCLPFTPESVSGYKADHQRRTLPKVLYFRPVVLLLASLAAFVAVSSIGWITLGWIVRPFYSFIALSALILCASCSIWLFNIQWPEPVGQWEMGSFSGHTGDIPVPMIELAMAIKEQHPEAKLYVEEFRRGALVLDPFLVVQGKGRDYYIAVWDEPGFAGERIGTTTTT